MTNFIIGSDNESPNILLLSERLLVKKRIGLELQLTGAVYAALPEYRYTINDFNLNVISNKNNILPFCPYIC